MEEEGGEGRERAPIAALRRADDSIRYGGDGLRRYRSGARVFASGASPHSHPSAARSSLSPRRTSADCYVSAGRTHRSTTSGGRTRVPRGLLVSRGGEERGQDEEARQGRSDRGTARNLTPRRRLCNAKTSPTCARRGVHLLNLAPASSPLPSISGYSLSLSLSRPTPQTAGDPPARFAGISVLYSRAIFANASSSSAGYSLARVALLARQLRRTRMPSSVWLFSLLVSLLAFPLLATCNTCMLRRHS